MEEHEADFSHLGEEGNLESVNGEPERSSGGTFQKLLDRKQSDLGYDTPVNEKPSKAIVSGEILSSTFEITAKKINNIENKHTNVYTCIHVHTRRTNVSTREGSCTQRCD